MRSIAPSSAPSCSGRARGSDAARLCASRGSVPRVVCAAQANKATGEAAPAPPLTRPKPASAEKQAQAAPPQPATAANQAAIQEAYKRANDAKARGETVEVKVVSQNEGGVMVQFGAARGFIPYTRLDPARLKEFRGNGDLSAMVGQRVKAKFVTVDPARRELILSERLVAAATALSRIQPGDVLEGVVTGLEDYGAFVQIKSLPEVSGLVHKTEVSWDRILTVDQALQIGQEVRAKVLSVDPTNCRLALSLRQLAADPLRASLDTLAWEAAGRDTQLDPAMQAFIDGLSRAAGVTAVAVKRVATDPHRVAQELEVYLTRSSAASIDEGEGVPAGTTPAGSFMAVARYGAGATEVQLYTQELTRDQVKQTLQRAARASTKA